MPRFTLKQVSLAAVALLLVAGLAAPATAADADAGYNSDLIKDLASLEEKLVGLAEAIPAEKYSWAPAEGVRGVSGAFMHMAQAQFFFPMQAGIQPPEGIEMGKLEEITDKDQVIATMKTSFEQMRKLVESVPADQLGETQQMFGQEFTKAGVLHAAISHTHEHLGQLIAYARSVGVTPPWSQ